MKIMKKLLIWCVAGLSLALSNSFVAFAKPNATNEDQRLSAWCTQLKKQQSCYNLHQQLAEQGRPESAYWIGKASARGMFEAADLTKALGYYQVASQEMHPAASRELGLLYYHGVSGERDFEKAQRLFELAIEQGNPQAIWALARMYHYGRGVEQNYNKAFELFSLAADKGSKPAASTLAYYYKVGLATEPNPRLASYWRNKANDQKLVTWNRAIPDYR
jgi:TPR repeat protein